MMTHPGQKLQGRHLDRLAVVYVRQSTVQQVERHQKSTRLQYGLVDRAIQLGWPRSRVLVIDDDLGRSGATAEGRPGFQRLVAEVGLDHVGLVLGIEMSRLARSCRDWHQLLDTCAVFGTLIADAEGLYDPTTYNDRLLLGLKGTMSEAELHVIKQRMHQGRLTKAQRGELGMGLPMGYMRRSSGEVTLDPDEEARGAIRLVFDLFARLGTLNGVLQHLVRHGIRLPWRLRTSLAKGELDWRAPNRATLQNMLRNPIYAGAYVWGRRPTDPRKKRPGRPSTGRRVAKVGEWQVFLKDRLPAYISWDQYEANLRQLDANRSSALGVIRRGAGLLPGLVVCGRCGLRMTVQYPRVGYPRYVCCRMAVDYAQPRCQSLRGDGLDRLVSDLVLQALEPSGLEVSLHAAEDIERERAQLAEHWKKRLERTRYESECARRQYNAVEPENRTVARTLERQWEEALVNEQALVDEHAREMARHPATLTAGDREAIRSLAVDIPALWNAPTTTTEDRQAIIRHLVERVLVTVIGESERVEVEIHWVGGHRTGTVLRRPVAHLDQLSNLSDLLARTRMLHSEGHRSQAIADVLNAEGWRPAKRCERFTAGMVLELLRRQGFARQRVPAPTASVERRVEWPLCKLALELDMPLVTLYSWVQKGLLNARREDAGSRSRWLVRADEVELVKLRALRAAPRTWTRHELVDGILH